MWPFPSPPAQPSGLAGAGRCGRPRRCGVIEARPVRRRRMSAAARSAVDRSRAAITVSAPALARARAVSTPIPLAAPVTRARRPCRSRPEMTSAALSRSPASAAPVLDLQVEVAAPELEGVHLVGQAPGVGFEQDTLLAGRLVATPGPGQIGAHVLDAQADGPQVGKRLQRRDVRTAVTAVMAGRVALDRTHQTDPLPVPQRALRQTTPGNRLGDRESVPVHAIGIKNLKRFRSRVLARVGEPGEYAGRAGAPCRPARGGGWATKHGTSHVPLSDGSVTLETLAP